MKSGNRYSAEMESRNGQVQRALFRKLLVDEGEACDLVTSATRWGRTKDQDLWFVGCENGYGAQVSFENDGNSKILDCAVAEAIDPTACGGRPAD